MTVWHVLTGEYPPQPGGVSDYTRLVARSLAAEGERVRVWSAPSTEETTPDAGVLVERLPDRFGARSLLVLRKALKREAGTRPRVLVQYVPHAFGWKALNLPFCAWLWSVRREASVWVMFHEVHFPVSRNQPAAHQLLGAVTRVMARLAARAAERIFVSIPAWEKILDELAPHHAPVEWMPVPSTIPVIEDAPGIKALRARYANSSESLLIGHFGTYAPHIRALLKEALPALLLKDERRAALLMGPGGEGLRNLVSGLYPELEGRVHATGLLTTDDLSRHLSACDLMLQPFGDGVSSRRTSVMTALAHALPVVTTSGALTETLWAESGAVALAPAEDADALAAVAEEVLEGRTRREALGRAALKLYRERFDVRHTLAMLRGADEHDGG